MSKLDVKIFNSITPFAKQWILGEETMYEFLYQYQDFLSDKYGIVDLGSLTWEAGATSGTEKRMQSDSIQNIIKRPSSAGTLADIKCLKYEVRTANGTYSKQVGISVDSAGRVIVYDENYTTAAQVAEFKAAMQGVYLIFRLADNIGRVRLGGLDWEDGSEQGGFLVGTPQMQSIGIKSGLCKLYSPNFGVYLQNFQWTNFADIPNNVVAKNTANRVLYAKATDYATPADFKASLANTYLYFEKQIIL